MQEIIGHVIDALAPVLAIVVAFKLGHRKADVIEKKVDDVHVIVNTRMDKALGRIQELETELATKDKEW
jgi:hypothetical protein